MDLTRNISGNKDFRSSTKFNTSCRQLTTEMGSFSNFSKRNKRASRDLVFRETKTSHKPERTFGNIKSTGESSKRNKRLPYLNSEQQSNYCINLKETRFMPLSYSSKNNSSNFTNPNKNKLHIRSPSYSRSKKCSSRLLISSPPSSSIRSTNIKKCILQDDKSSTVKTGNRPLCNKIQQEIRNLSFFNSRQRSRNNKYLYIQLGKLQNSLCLPSSKSNPQSLIQMEQGETGNNDFSSPRLANSDVVLPPSNQNIEKNKITTSPGRPPSENNLRGKTNRPLKVSLDRTHIIKSFIPKNFSKNLKNKLIHSTRASTEKHYQIHWKRFVEFCNNKKLPINKTSVYEFFNSLIDRQLSYGSLLQYRSALTKPLKFLISDLNLLEDIYIKDLLRYAKSHLLKKDKNFPKWSLEKILEMLASTQFNSLCSSDHSLLFKKVIFLTALASPRRISEFQAFSISKSNFKNSEIILRTHSKFVKKNASATFSPSDIKIPSFPENNLLCPVYNLLKYLQITNSLCQKNNSVRPDQLFINTEGAPITKHQLRASIRNIIARADPFSLTHSTSFHSIRHVASTMLDYRGFTTSQILEQMQWKSSDTYHKYYCKLGWIEESPRGCIVAGKHIPST